MKDDAALIDRAVQCSRRRLQTRHVKRMFDGQPDPQYSYVEHKKGHYVVVCSTSGEPMFIYRITKKNRLRYWGESDSVYVARVHTS